MSRRSGIWSRLPRVEKREAKNDSKPTVSQVPVLKKKAPKKNGREVYTSVFCLFLNIVDVAKSYIPSP